jgi:O-antigen/teichoic acid export membrane protein
MSELGTTPKDMKVSNSQIKQQAISAAKWTSVTTILIQFITFIISVVKFRVLAIDLFGTMAIVNVFISIARMIQSMGFGPAIVQKDQIDHTFLSTVFWIILGVSTIMGAILVLLSGLISEYYKLDILIVLLKIASIQFIVNSFIVVQKYILSRDLHFKKIGFITLASSIGGGLITIVLALNDFEIWSLVFGSVASTIISMILYGIYSTWLPSLIFDWGSIKSSIKFSIDITVQKTIATLRMTAPQLIIGKVLGLEALGLYSFAKNIMLLILKNVDAVLSSVLFPLFSRLQKDFSKLLKSYLIVNHFTFIITLPIIIGFILLAEDLIIIFYGEKWYSAVVLSQILIIATAVQSIYDRGASIFSGIGRPDILLKIDIIIFFPAIILYVISAHYGLLYFVIALAGERVLILLIQLRLLKKNVGLNILDFAKTIKYPIIASLIMMGSLLAIMGFIPENSIPKIELGSLIAFGAVIYGIIILYVDRREIMPVLKLLVKSR